jgi:tol-pal system protein YbgF
MRLPVSVLATLLVTQVCTTAAFAASREQQEMQRDIAQLQDQVRTLQSGFDQRMAALQTLVQQTLDAATRSNTNISVLSSSLTQAIEREMSNRLTPIAGVSSRIDNLGNDMAEVKGSLSDLSSQINKLRQQLGDVNNAIKVIQAPPAPPPGAEPGRSAPPPPAATIFTNGMTDYSGGKFDLAIDEFTNFVKLYPDDPQASTAQMFIGQMHFTQKKYDLAVLDFDTILERFPESSVTPDAWLMKGRSLRAGNHGTDAAKVYRDLRAKYPKSDQAKQAGDELVAMGATLGAARPPAARKK